MHGGPGADSFAFEDGDSGETIITADRIVDFNHAQSDRPNLLAIVAKAGGADNAFSFSGVAASGSVSGQLRNRQSGGNTFVECDISSDGVADFIIRIDGLLVYDAEPRAAREVRFTAMRRAAAHRAQVALLDTTPDTAASARLAARYTNPELGHIDVTRADGRVHFDFGAFGSAVTTLRNTDGTIAFITTDPAVLGFDFTVRPRSGAYDALVVREAQHEYVYEPVL